ncbi:MAG: phosphoglucosamine mutase, partial [Nitriliruptoraceae bacterium]
FNGRDATDTRSELGARFDRVLARYTNAVLALRGRLAWAHDWVSDPTLGSVFQALAGASFIVNGATPAENSALTSAGADARTVGVLPTAAVAHLTARSSALAGAMISASHNPVGDNGIKFFGADGFKLSDEQESALESLVESVATRPRGTEIGRRMSDQTAVARYIEHLTSAVDIDLAGLRIVVDGANGAASSVAPQVYRQLGADVHTIHCKPDGANINDQCGSTHPDVVARAVVEHDADIGISHDGDADRVVAATSTGQIVDGDVILAILARDMANRGVLAKRSVATTVMTNLGFRRAMADLSIEVVETPVGDRHVLEAMRERGLNLGGEQSGHVIDLDIATTGDGILTAVLMLAVMARTDTALGELAEVMQRLPQVLVNVGGVDRTRLDDAAGVWDAVDEAAGALGDTGRVLLRPSGTEPLVRVMVEAADEATAADVAERIADVVRRELAVDGAATSA